MTHSPFYRSRPNADTAVLMIHGILGTPRHFDWLIPTIPDAYQISNILLPGHGGTISDFSHSTMSQWQAHVERSINELEQSGRRIIIVAHSLGTLLALNAAEKHKSICGMILLNVPFCPRLRIRLIGKSLRAAFGKPNWDDPYEVLYYRACGTATEPYLWKYLGWIPNFCSLLKLCRQSRPIPKCLSIPCYAYLGGDDDLVHPRSKKWLQNCPNMTLRFFPDGTHFGYSQWEQSQIISDFNCLLHSQFHLRSKLHVPKGTLS